MVELRVSEVGETTVIGMAEREKGRDDPGQSRWEKVKAKLRTNHLNSEEKISLHELCFDYQDVFLLPEDKLSCKNVARHTTQLEPGVTSINTWPYWPLESQKEEVDWQEKQLLEDRS